MDDSITTRYISAMRQQFKGPCPECKSGSFTRDELRRHLENEHTVGDGTTKAEWEKWAAAVLSKHVNHGGRSIEYERPDVMFCVVEADANMNDCDSSDKTSPRRHRSRSPSRIRGVPPQMQVQTQQKRPSCHLRLHVLALMLAFPRKTPG